MNRPTKVIAGSLGLTAFSIAIVAGIASRNLSQEILLRALIAMFVCYLVGLVLGMIGERTVEEHVRQYIAARPMPDASHDAQAPPVPSDGGKDGGKLVPSPHAG